MTSHPLSALTEEAAHRAFLGAWDSSTVEHVPHLGVSPTGAFEWETSHTTVLFDLADPDTLCGIDRGVVTVHVDDAPDGRKEVEPILWPDPYGPWDLYAAAGVADAVKTLVGRVFATQPTSRRTA